MVRPLLLFLAFAVPVSGQAPAREFALDARPFAGSLSFAWRIDPATMLGIVAGGGIDELDRTLAPGTNTNTFHPMEQILYIGSFLRFKPTAKWDVDAGARLGFGDIRECFASDCWPAPYAGVYGNAFWGGRRVKLGPRVMAAVVSENGHNDVVVHVEILTARIAVGW